MKIERSAYSIIIAVLAVFFVGYYYYFSVNFPIIDDTAFINYVYFFKNTAFSVATIPDFVSRLFRVDNDHSLVIPRLITLIDYAISGSINFKTLLLFISGVTVVIFYRLYQASNLSKSNLKYLLPAAFLYFQPQYYDVSNWTLSGLNHVLVTFFLVVALKLIKRDKWGWAMLIASAGVFTSGNGVLIFVVAAFVAVFFKQYKRLWLICGVLGVNLLVYFAFYTPGQENKLADVLNNLGRVISSFVLLAGSVNYGWLGTSNLPAMVTGVMIISIFIICTINLLLNPKSDQRNGVILLGIILFNLLTFALIAASRASGQSDIVSSRYQFYTIVATVSSYLLGIELIQPSLRKYLFAVVMIFSVTFNVASYYTYTQIVHFNSTRYTADAENWVSNRTMLAIHPDFVKNLGFYLPAATDQKIWNPKNHLMLNQNGRMLDFIPNKPLGDKFAIFERRNEYSQTSRRDNVSYIFSVKDLPVPPTLTSKWFVVLKSESDGHFYYLPISFLSSGKKAFILGEGYFQNQGYVQLNAESLANGLYEIYYLAETNSQKLFRSNQALRIENLEITTQKFQPE